MLGCLAVQKRLFRSATPQFFSTSCQATRALCISVLGDGRAREFRRAYRPGRNVVIGHQLLIMTRTRGKHGIQKNRSTFHKL